MTDGKNLQLQKSSPSLAMTFQAINKQLSKVEQNHSMTLKLYEAIRRLIVSGSYFHGAKLPASRKLAKELEWSRNTIVFAYEKLREEGFIEMIQGSGAYVMKGLHDVCYDSSIAATKEESIGKNQICSLSDTGKQILEVYDSLSPLNSGPLSVDYSDTSIFRFDVWARLHNRIWRRPSPELISIADPSGYLPLRAAIAEYVRNLRGVDCTADEVVITSGTGHAFQMLSKLLLNQGDSVLIENPGYSAWRIFGIDGATLVPSDVDAQGMQVSEALVTCPNAKIVGISPSAQFPLGSVLSLARRMQLLEWSKSHESWIIEDDYNCEFQFSGTSIAAMQSFDRDGRVVHVGTFSKTLFRGIRLGYIIANQKLASCLAKVIRIQNGHIPIMPQAVLAAFIQEGHFSSHVRKMRRRYAQRRAAALEAISHHLGDSMKILPPNSGLQVTAMFNSGDLVKDYDKKLAKKAASQNLLLKPLSTYYFGNKPRQGFVFGFASLPKDRADQYFKSVKKVLSNTQSTKGIKD